MERIKQNTSQCLIWMVTALTAVLFIETVAFSQNLAAVLPLNTNSQTELFPSSLLADPYVEGSAISDESAAGNLSDEIRTLQDELKVAKGSMRETTQDRIFEAYAVLCLYLAEQGEKEQSSKNIQRAATCNQNLLQIAKNLRGSTKSQEKKARLDFHVLAQGYHLGHKATAITGFQTLLKNRNLDKNIKQKAAVIVALHGAMQAKPAAQSKNLARLTQLSKGLTAKSKVALTATLARIAAKSQNKTMKALAEQNMRNTANQASGLHPDLHDAVLAHLVSTWQISHGKNMNWSRPPFALTNFQGRPGAHALVERHALQEIQNRRYAQGAKIYEILAADAYQSKNAGALNRRVLEVYELEYLKTDKPQRYEQKLGELMAANLSDQAIKGKYHSFVSREISIGKNTRSTQARRSLVIAVATNYSSSVDGKDKQQLAETIAQLYGLNQQYAAAVGIYIELGQGQQGQERLRFMTLAANYQHILAKIEQNPRFDRKLPATAESQKLLGIYEELYKLNPNWQSASILGLLQSAHGNTKAAYEMWTAQLQKDPSHRFAGEASGQMLQAYAQVQDWDSQISLIKLCMEKQVMARIQGKAVNLQQLLATALFTGGKQSYAQGDFKKSKERFAEFTSKFKQDPRRPEGLYLLALSAHETKEFTLALKASNDIVDQYPGAKEFRPALLFGGALSQKMALEEHTIKYYSMFVARFKKDEKFRDVNADLLQVYLGKQLYAEANYLHSLRLESSLYSAEEKNQSRETMLDLEYQYGDGNRAVALANGLIKNPAMSDLARAKAIRVIARETVGKVKDFSTLAPYLSMLEQKMDGNNPEVQDVRSELLYYKAELVWSGAEEEIFNIGLKDPTAKVGEISKQFQAMKQSYAAACIASSAAFCAPAHFQLARRAETILSNIENVDIAATLSEQETSKFHSLKSSLVHDVTSTIAASDSRAVALVQEGGITPEWTGMILWNHQADYIETTDATNFGYVQWNMQ